jgi:hypothetical protein
MLLPQLQGKLPFTAAHLNWFRSHQGPGYCRIKQMSAESSWLPASQDMLVDPHTLTGPITVWQPCRATCLSAAEVRLPTHSHSHSTGQSLGSAAINHSSQLCATYHCPFHLWAVTYPTGLSKPESAQWTFCCSSQNIGNHKELRGPPAVGNFR